MSSTWAGSDRVRTRCVRHQGVVVMVLQHRDPEQAFPGNQCRAAAAWRGLPLRPSVGAKRTCAVIGAVVGLKGPDARLTLTSVAIVHQSRGPVSESHNFRNTNHMAP